MPINTCLLTADGKHFRDFYELCEKSFHPLITDQKTKGRILTFIQYFMHNLLNIPPRSHIQNNEPNSNRFFTFKNVECSLHIYYLKLRMLSVYTYGRLHGLTILIYGGRFLNHNCSVSRSLAFLYSCYPKCFLPHLSTSALIWKSFTHLTFMVQIMKLSL